MHAAARIAQALGQARLDRRVPIFIAVVQNETAFGKIDGERIEFAQQRSLLVGRNDTDIGEPFDVRLAGGDVVQEELAIEYDVVAGEETHDAGIDVRVGLLPERLSHGGVLSQSGMAVSSSKPSARLTFCIAWVAAPLSRLSSVATTTTRRPSVDKAKPPTSR